MTQRAPHSDPRVARSHQRLRDALFALTLERGWDHVSVQQVCERAGVGRSTFYVHFADREELLLAAFQSDHIVSGRLRVEPLAFVRPLVEHVGEQRSLYNALAGTSCEVVVQRRFKEVVAELVDDELDACAAPSGSQRLHTVRYVAGAFCETLTYWLKQRNAPSASEIEQLFKQCSMPSFERIR